MMTNLIKSLLTLVGIQENPILTGVPGNKSHVDTINSTSMHTNPPVMGANLSQNWIWFSLEAFGLSGSCTHLKTIQLMLTQSNRCGPL